MPSFLHPSHQIVPLIKAVECSLEGLETFWQSLLLNAQHRGEKTENTASYQLGQLQIGNFPTVHAFVYKIGLLWLVETQELSYYTLQMNAVCSTVYTTLYTTFHSSMQYDTVESIYFAVC